MSATAYVYDTAAAQWVPLTAAMVAAMGGSGGGTGRQQTLTLASGAAQTADVTDSAPPITCVVHPAPGDTVLLEVQHSAAWSAVGTYTALSTVVLDTLAGEAAPTAVRATRTAGAGTTSKVTVDYLRAGNTIVGAAVTPGAVVTAVEGTTGGQRTILRQVLSIDHVDNTSDADKAATGPIATAIGAAASAAAAAAAAAASAIAAAATADTKASAALADAGQVRAHAGATYALTNADHGDTIKFTAACTVTHPAGLRSDFAVTLVQGAAGAVTLTSTGGVTYYPALAATTAQDQVVTIARRDPVAEEYLVAASGSGSGGTVDAASVTAAIQAASSTQAEQIRAKLGGRALSHSRKFEDAVAGAALVYDFRFGAAAAGGTHNIRNLADLNTHCYWDPVDTASPLTTRMAYHDQYHEFAKFDDADAGSIFMFGASDLTLQPIASHSWDGMVTEVPSGQTVLSGSPAPIASLGLANTSALWLGRVVHGPYDSNYAARVTAFDATTVTLTRLDGVTGVNLVQSFTHLLTWTAMTAAVVPAGAASGATSLTLSAAPEAGRVQTGMVVAPVDGFNYIKRYYYGSTITLAGATVTIAEPGLQQAIAAGGLVVFFPRTRTGQIVPKVLFEEPGAGGAWLMELDATRPNVGGIMPSSRYMATLSQFNALGGLAIPSGTWASWWLYELQTAALLSSLGLAYSARTGSEIDMEELWGALEHGTDAFNCAVHNATEIEDANGTLRQMVNGEGYPIYARDDGTHRHFYTLRAQAPDGTSDPASVIPAGVHHRRVSGTQPAAFKRQMLWEHDRVSFYNDNQLMVTLRGQWASDLPAQMLINAALGSLRPGGNRTPWSDTALANSRMVLRGLKVWRV
jgi:hypothetical protein